MGNNVRNYELLESLNGSKRAKFDIDCGTGSLFVSQLFGEEQGLAKGVLQYREQQGEPDRSVNTNSGQTELRLKAGRRQPGFRFPWSACGGKTDWKIEINPTVTWDIDAHSNGGNVKLDLAGLAVSHLSAESGGGSVDMVLPDRVANLTGSAKSGAGNVSIDVSAVEGSNAIDVTSGAGNVLVRLPKDVAARIYASTGWGKVNLDPRFAKIDKNIYQSPDYGGAVNKMEIALKSGAGNVIVNTK